jgi:hypothetical protein
VQAQLTDYVVMGLVTAIGTAGTVYIFVHPSEAAFGIWAGVVSTVTAAYHWITVYDDKRPDDHA